MPTDNKIGYYKPLTPDERGQWNGFLSYLGSQKANLDADPELGHAYMAHYANQNPDFKLTPDHVASVQQDHDNIRNGDLIGDLSSDQLSALRNKLNPAFMKQPLPEVNGVIDSKTASLFYPTAKIIDSKGRQIQDHGTDIESYAKNYLTPPDKPTAEPVEKPGAAINPTDKDAQEWLQSYIESPKYKERLNNFWKDPAYVQQTRDNQLKDVKFSETSGTKLVDGQVVRNGATVYDSADNSMNVNPDQLKELKAGRGESDVHELAHGQNSGEYKSTQLNPVEQDYIFQRETQPTSDDKKYWPQYAEKQGQSISDELAHNAATHDIAPSENMSDIQALRYMAHKKGIYDARTQDLTPELLQKIKADPDIKNSFTGKRVFSNFDDKGLLDIMNKIAYRENNTDQNLA
jgi:hypothetical protein